MREQIGHGQPYSQIIDPPVSEANREIANLTERTSNDNIALQSIGLAKYLISNILLYYDIYISAFPLFLLSPFSPFPLFPLSSFMICFSCFVFVQFFKNVKVELVEV